MHRREHWPVTRQSLFGNNLRSYGVGCRETLLGAAAVLARQQRRRIVQADRTKSGFCET